VKARATSGLTSTSSNPVPGTITPSTVQPAAGPSESERRVAISANE
jgi:hypothetical protein